MRACRREDSCWSRTVLARVNAEPTLKSSPMNMKAFTHRSVGMAQIPMLVMPSDRAKVIHD